MDRIAKLREYLEASPKDDFLRHALALEYVKIGNYAGAKTLWTQLLEDSPAYTGAYYHLAQLLERMGEKETAEVWFKKGLDACRKAKDTHAYNELLSAYTAFQED